MDAILLILIGITGYLTYKGFQSHGFLSRYMFQVDGILRVKQYDRMFTSGFLHGDWMHFAFNMFALYSFAKALMFNLGIFPFLIIYFVSMLGGSLLALYIHRNHGSYSAVGASGAVSGLVMASIFLEPSAGIGLLFLPIHIPAWIFGCLFLVYSIYGIKNQSGNIGHEAHLGGAIVGLLLALAIHPQSYASNAWVFWLLFTPTAIFLYLIYRYPNILILGSFHKGIKGTTPKRSKFYRDPELTRQQQLDQLLDKINRHGIDQLTAEEKRKLDELTGRI